MNHGDSFFWSSKLSMFKPLDGVIALDGGKLLWKTLGIHKWKQGIISYPSLDWNPIW